MRAIDHRTHAQRLARTRAAANDSRLGLPSDTPAPQSTAWRIWTGRATGWPLLALLAWASAWGSYALLQAVGAPGIVAALTATGLGALCTLAATTPMRRLIVAAGFPLSLAAAGAAPLLAGGLPAWGWLIPLALLALIYPASAWRDAPLFPTPAGALDALSSQVFLPAGARVHDAGCGLGDGLAALRRAYPQARLEGIERSAPIAWLAALRARRAGLDARISRGDMWAVDWRGIDLVYLFQRPESLPRAVTKARSELRGGAWLASLEFPATGLRTDRVLTCPDGRPLWLYRAPFTEAASRFATPAASASSFTAMPTDRPSRARAPRSPRR